MHNKNRERIVPFLLLKYIDKTILNAIYCKCV